MFAICLFQFFRQAKEFFDKPTVEFVGGLSLTKTAEGRQAKALEDNAIAVETAKSVDERNTQIQNYLFTELKNFFQERSLNFNFANAARSISNAIPDDVKAEMRGLVEEGRLKKRKLLRKLMPILMGLKVKFVALGVLTLFGLLFIAKKALVVSFIALALSLFSGLSGLSQKSGGGLGGGLFSGLGNLFGGGAGGGYSAGGAGWAGNGGWSSGGGWSGGNSGWDSHGAYSSPVAQTVAYSGHKQVRRR